MGDVTATHSDVKPLTKEIAWEDESNLPERLKGQVYVKHIKGPIFFGSTSHFQELANQVPKKVSYLIIRMDRVPYIDQSGLYAIEDVLVDLAKDAKRILFVGLNDQPKYLMERIDIIPDLVLQQWLFSSFDDCVAWIKKDLED